MNASSSQNSVFGAADGPQQAVVRAAAQRPEAAVARDPFAGQAPPPRPRFGSPRIRKKDLVMLTSQLAIMTRSGVDVAAALQSLARQSRNPGQRAVLEAVHQNVLSGNGLSESMGEFPKAFDATFVASVAAGEASGRLPDVLSQLASLQRSDSRLRSSIRAMLAYPLILVGVSSVVVAALLLFVLPQFAKIFDDFEAPLPVLTQLLLQFSDELRTRWWLWIPLMLAGGGGLLAFGLSPAGRRLRDRLLLNSIIVRDVTRALLIGRTCRMLGLMSESGVPLLESLRLVRMAAKNSFYRELFDRLEFDVLNGRGLTGALIDSEFVPPAAAEMMGTAEKTGTLATVTQLVGEHYEEEGQARLRELVAITEPAITVAMGCVVAVIVFSVMLPLFDLSSAVK